MKTFNGNQKVKDFYIKRLEKHQAANEITQKPGWENNSNKITNSSQVFIGIIEATVHSEYTKQYEDYEKELGIPSIIARLEDRIFFGMDEENAKSFPLQFLTSVPVGVDLQNIYTIFSIWLLVDVHYGIIKYAEGYQKLPIQKFADFLNSSLTKPFTVEEIFNILKKFSAAEEDSYLDHDQGDPVAKIKSSIAEDLYRIAAGHANAASEFYRVFITYAAMAVDTAAELYAAFHKTKASAYYGIAGQSLIKIISDTAI